VRQLDSLGENTVTNFHFTTHALNVLPDARRLRLGGSQRTFANRERIANLQDYVHPGLVHHPAYMSIRVLPADYKQVVHRQDRRLQRAPGWREQAGRQS